MAVPRTHDGSVGPRSTSGSSVPTVVPAVLAVVVVACLVVLGTRYADASGPVGDRVEQVFTGGDPAEAAAAAVDDTRTRELVLSQANQFMIRINTYGPPDLDDQGTMPGYVTRVQEVITPKLDVEFQKSVTLAEQSVAQAGLARSVTLYATGAQTIEDDLATVLITGAISQSYPDPAPDAEDGARIEYEPQLFRYEVRLVRTDGTWKVDDFTPVRGEVEGEPTAGAPTDPADPVDPVDPGAEPLTGAAAIVGSYVEIVGRRQLPVAAAVETLTGCGFPTATDESDPACATAPDALADAATSLANSLRGAANPDSQVFVGEPPATIADLVAQTQTSAAAVARSVARLGDDCAVSVAAGCAAPRNAVTAATNDLTQTLETWTSVG